MLQLRKEIKKMKELIFAINHEDNFDKAEGMLEMFNRIYNTNYLFLNRRVTEFKDGRFQDVWASL